MAENKFNGVVGSLLTGMDSILSTKTVVGEPTQIGDTIILPLVDVSFAVGAGSSSAEKKDGGAGGLAGKMTPSAVLVIKDGYTKLVNIKNQDTITKVFDLIPDLVDRFTGDKNKKPDMPSDDAVVDIAFPEEGVVEEVEAKEEL